MPHPALEWCAAPVAWLLVDGMAYRVRRVDSSALRAVGFAHLEGSEAYAAAQQEIAAERREQLAAMGQHADEAARAAAVAKARAVEQRRAARSLVALTATREGAAAFRARCDAYLCAAIDAAAELAVPVDEPTIVYDAPAVAGAWVPWRWTSAPEEHDPGAGVVSIGYLPEPVRDLLGLAVQGALQGVTRRRVGAFRAGSGPAAAPPPDRAGVRDDAGGDSAVEP